MTSRITGLPSRGGRSREAPRPIPMHGRRAADVVALANAAANDACLVGLSGTVADVNQLVARLISHLTPVLCAHQVDLELDLGANLPFVCMVPEELAFALAGVVTAQLRGMQGDGGRLRLETLSHGHTVRVRVLSDCVPLLLTIRALAPDHASSAPHDTIMAHCRRLTENYGGYIDLTDEPGLLGFDLCFPAVLGATPQRLRANGRLTMDEVAA